MADSNGESSSPQMGEPLQLDVARIRRWKDQPRKHFDDADLQLLGESLSICQIDPITVRKITDDPEHDFELIEGERRLRAARKVGLKTLSAWIDNRVRKPQDQLLHAVVTDSSRNLHTPVERAEALYRLNKAGRSPEQIAKLVGRPLDWVENHLRLMTDLVPDVRALMDPERPQNQRLPFEVAVLISRAERDAQLDLATALANRKLKSADVRALVNTRVRDVGATVRARQRSAEADVEHRVLTAFVQRLAGEAATAASMQVLTLRQIFEGRDNEVPALKQEIEKAIGHLNTLLRNIDAATTAVAAR